MPRGRKPHIDRQLVLATYRELGTCAAVATRLGIAHGSVSNILRELGVGPGKGQNSPLAIRLPMEALARRYEMGETCADLARAYGTNPERIRRKLRREGMTRRVGKAPGRRNFWWVEKKAEEPLHYHRRQSYEVAAICLGRPVEPGWVIHHLDGDQRNNRPENLVLFPRQALHAAFHARLQKLRREGQPVGSSQQAIESGARALPPPPHPLSFAGDRDRPVPSETPA